MDHLHRNYRPASKVPLGMPRFPMWRSLLIGAIVFAAYPLADYVTRQGDVTAIKEENERLRQQLRIRRECSDAMYSYPRIPPAIKRKEVP